MEIALEPQSPTYSGGLGILAGDTIRSAADLGIPMVAVTLLHRQGYFRQSLDSSGNQIDHDDSWNSSDRLERPLANSGGHSFTVPYRSREIPCFSMR